MPENQKDITSKAGRINVLDIIAPSALEVNANFVKIGKKFARTFFVFSYPKYLMTGWFSPIINLDWTLDISIMIHPQDTGLVLKQLLGKVTQVEAEIIEREQKGLVRDPMLEASYRNLEDLRDKLQSAEERMFKFGLYITVYGDSFEELQKAETTIRSVLESHLVYMKPALYQQKEGFNTTNPLLLDYLLIYTPLNTGPLSTLFPFVSFDMGSGDGILYGINRHNNSLILFDRFSLENYNTVIFGKAGGGKSILGSDNVLVKSKGKIQLTKIGPLIDGLIKKHGATPIDKECEGVINPELEVYSFNNNLKGEWSKVSVAARKDAPDTFYKFKTASGREITTTKDHNMLTISNGRVMATRSSEVKKGDYIPLSRFVAETSCPIKNFNLLELLRQEKWIYVVGAQKLIQENCKPLKKVSLDKRLDRYLYKYKQGRPIPIQYFWKILNRLEIQSKDARLKNLKIEAKGGKTQYPINFPITSDLLKIAGYISSEGTVRDDFTIISNKDREVLQDLDQALRKLEVSFFYGNSGIVITSKVFIRMIKALGGKNLSGQKRVWPFIFNLKKKEIAAYLASYFEGDGGVEHDAVKAVSKSSDLVSDLTYLLNYFGIIARISKTKKRAPKWTHKKTYWILSISGQENLKKFAENINFISERKKGLLSKLIKKTANSNVDLIPSLEATFQEIYELFTPQLHGIPEISEWKRGKRKPSPQHLQKVIEKIEKRIESFRDLSSSFEILNDLPSLSSVINLGKSNKILNRKLWQNLGTSWPLIKNQKNDPGSVNVLKAIDTLGFQSYSLGQIKEVLHQGFKEMDLSVKHYNHCLQSALVARPRSNTSYTTIFDSAQFVWNNYQDKLSKIAYLEEKLELLKNLANSELFWDPIVEIKKINNKKEKFVYDLTVDNRVFLAGRGGLFVHNSYFSKLEILRSLMFGIDVIVIDPEKEYQYLAETVGGSFFKISLTGGDNINPFDLPKPLEDEEPADVLRSNIINLVGLLRLMLGGLTPEEDSIIDRAITETYASRDITPESDFSKITPPLMGDLHAMLEGMEGGRSLALRLEKYTKGTFSGFLNQPTNLDMKNQLVVFSIRDMEEELRPIAMFLILRFIWNTIRSELKKRLLIVDEAWWLMKHDDGASFLYGISKRARKYFLALTTITQDVSDFMNSAYGQPIIANSSLQLLLRQSPATVNVVSQTFNLTEEEKYLLLESEIGEGLLFAGLKHVAIKIVSSLTEDKIITSSPEEVMERKKEELL